MQQKPKGRPSKMPDELKEIVSSYIRRCPICGEEVADDRFKKGTVSSPLTVRRFTPRTITFECRLCKGRFSMTWKSFQNSLINLAQWAQKKVGPNNEVSSSLVAAADEIGYQVCGFDRRNSSMRTTVFPKGKSHPIVYEYR